MVQLCALALCALDAHTRYSTKGNRLISYLDTVFEIRELKLKKENNNNMKNCITILSAVEKTSYVLGSENWEDKFDA